VGVDDTLLVLESLDAPPRLPDHLGSPAGTTSSRGRYPPGSRGLWGGRTLEPGESVEDRAFLGLPDSGYGAIRVTATVASRGAGKCWFNDEVVVVDPRVDYSASGEAEGGPAQPEGDAP